MTRKGEREPLDDVSKPAVCTIETPQVDPHIETLEWLRSAVVSVDGLFGPSTVVEVDQPVGKR